MNYLIT